MSDTAITAFEPVRALVTPEQAKEQYKTFEELKAALLSPNDYATIMGKPYVTKSGFRKIAVVFGLSDEIVDEEKHVRVEDLSFYWRVRVRVTAPNGRTSEGVAICDSKEKNFAHVEHDVYATAHTRAKNRAISDMVAGGLVSAEEMETTATAKPKSKQTPPRKNVDVKVKVVPKNQIAVTEDTVKATLAAHGLDTDDLTIYTYSDTVRVQFNENPTQDRFNELNDVLHGTLKATWSRGDERWDLPQALPRNGMKENDDKKTDKS